MRRWGSQYSATHAMFAEQRRAMRSIAACRTAALGGHKEKCAKCGDERPAYNSCGDRHCPMCGGIRMRKWLSEQLSDLLPVPYYHCIFTIPDSFNVLIPRNERVIYGILFEAAAKTLQALAREHWWAEPGMVATLHTWGQTLQLHPHVHIVVTGGGLSLDCERWVEAPGGGDFLFDVHVCSNAFRKRFCRLMRRRFGKMTFVGEASNYADGEAFAAFIAEQEAKSWNVNAQRPVAGEANALAYLSRYTHRVAISNRRITDISDDGKVTIDYKDYRDEDESGAPKHKQMVFDAVEFIGRFLRHVLPAGFRRIRSYGILAPAHKDAKLAKCRELLEAEEPDVEELVESLSMQTEDRCCAKCGHDTFRIVGELKPQRGPPLILYSGDGHAAA